MVDAKKIPATLRIAVRFCNGTYIARAHGKSASCTSSDEVAVDRLIKKLWGAGKHIVSLVVGETLSGYSLWDASRRYR